jgi:hypothetical protein
LRNVVLVVVASITGSLGSEMIGEGVEVTTGVVAGDAAAGAGGVAGAGVGTLVPTSCAAATDETVANAMAKNGIEYRRDVVMAAFPSAHR